MVSSSTKNSTKLRATLEIPVFPRRLERIGETSRLCLHCGVKISERRMRYGAKYCNDECKNKYRLNQLKKEVVNFRQTCMFCDEPISEKKKRYNALYCSDGCRNRAKIKRARERIETIIADMRYQRDEEEKAWREFDERNPNVYDYIKSDLLKLIGATEGALSVGAVIEYQVRMIWGQKIPNAYKKFYREKFIREYPEYAKLFA